MHFDLISTRRLAGPGALIQFDPIWGVGVDGRLAAFSFICYCASCFFFVFFVTILSSGLPSTFGENRPKGCLSPNFLMYNSCNCAYFSTFYDSPAWENLCYKTSFHLIKKFKTRKKNKKKNLKKRFQRSPPLDSGRE